MAERIRVVAHRACPLDAVENSLAGVRRAAELGADLVEVDVRLTRDGVPVLMHDRTAWRAARHPRRVARLGHDRLRRLRLADGAAPPSLAEALEALPAGLGMALDLKDPAVAPVALDIVREHGLTDRVELWCRAPATLADLARSAPDVRRALLRAPRGLAAEMRLLADALACDAHAVSVPETTATAALVRLMGSLDVYAWVRRAGRHERALDAGVAAVVTDWPVLARRLVDARR